MSMPPSASPFGYLPRGPFSQLHRGTLHVPQNDFPDSVEDVLGVAFVYDNRPLSLAHPFYVEAYPPSKDLV